MGTEENTSDIRRLTDAELENASGGVGPAVPFIFAGLFILGLAMGADESVNVPRSLDELYASW